jgi:hypothetical protein
MPYPTFPSGSYLFVKGGDVGTGAPNNGGAAPGSGGIYVVNGSDAGTGVNATAHLTVFPNYVITTEVYVVPSTSPYQLFVQHGGLQRIVKADGTSSDSVIYQYPADGEEGASGATGGVMYYPSGTAFTSVGENGTPAAAGEYGWSNTTNPADGTGGWGLYTFDSADAGKEVIIRYVHLSPDYQAYASQFAAALQFTAGKQTSDPSAYMTAHHADQAVGYSLSAQVELDNGYIGVSATLPDYTYEVQGFNVVGGGTVDADPVECMETLLTDPLIGIGFPSAYVDQKTWFTNASSASNWVRSQGLYLSQAIRNPESAGTLVGRWLQAFNIGAFWSEGLLKIVPYGDQQTSGTDAYVPDNTVVASFGDNDYIAGAKEDPVRVTRTPWADAYNRVQVSYRNRDNAYNPDLVYEQDEGSIERFGLRIKAPETLDFVGTWQIAQQVANMRLKRYVTVRNSYEFGVPITFEYIEPMDLVALTDSRLGLDGQVVRVTKVQNDPAKGLKITCEDFPGNGYAMPVSHPKAALPPTHPSHGSAPAGATTAIILQASNITPNQTSTRVYIWAAPASLQAWGGCAIFVSMDGSSYQQLGVVTTPASAYTLTATLPSVTPAPSGSLGLTHDTSSTIEVVPAITAATAHIQSTVGLVEWSAETDYAAGDAVILDGLPWGALSPNAGSMPGSGNPNWQLIPAVSTPASPLSSVSDAAAAALANLAAVVATSGGAPSAVEFLSFATVSAGSGQNQLNLTDLYRGALGTTIGSFAAGSQMVLFSAASATWDVPAGLAGQTVYFRFVPWNAFGATHQSLDDAVDVEFVIAASDAIGVWDGLGKPISDVIANNAGNGELIVDPVGGVTGNLPYANHAAQVMSVINTSSQITSGTEIAGVTESALTMQVLHDRVSATIGGYTATGLDNVDDGSTYLRPQGVSSGHQLTYHGLYGDTSGDTTTAIVDAANKRFVHGAMSTPTQAVINTSSQVTAATEIAGVTETPLTMQVLHDRVSATIGGYGNTGTDNLISGANTNVTPNNLGAEGMVDNGSFQRGTAGWTVGDANSIDVQSSNPPVATMSYLHVNTTVANTGATYARKFDVQPGGQYKVVGWVYSNDAYFDFQAQDATGADKLDSVVYGTTANAWSYVSTVATIPAGATQATLFLAGNAVGDFYFTGVNVYKMRGIGGDVYDDGVGAMGYRLANVASDNTGVTLGYSGKTQLEVGDGFFSPSTGGHIPVHTYWTQSTGTEANGTVISFSALKDQAGNSLPTFGAAPLVALQPYNMTSPPQLLYASAVTTTGFTLNSYSAGTASNGTAVNLPEGNTETVNATSGTTITGATFTATVVSQNVYSNPNFEEVIACYVNGSSVGTITVNGKANGGTYQGSLNVGISGSPTSFTAEATWSLASVVSSVTATVTPGQISGATPVSANVTCAITEPWSS